MLVSTVHMLPLHAILERLRSMFVQTANVRSKFPFSHNSSNLSEVQLLLLTNFFELLLQITNR